VRWESVSEKLNVLEDSARQTTAELAYFEEDDAEREHLLANIELILSDMDIAQEVVGEGISDIATVEFCREIF